MAKRSTFTKAGGSTYKCECCGRGTRNTGSQSLGSKTCPQCWDLAGIENEISDGHCTLEERRTLIDELLAEIRAKGGNPDAEFAKLLPVVKPAPSHPNAVTVKTAQGLTVEINFDRTADVCWSCEIRGERHEARGLSTLMSMIAEYIGHTEF